MFPDDDQLNSADFDFLLSLDDRGIFPAPGETQEQFMDYVRHLRDSYSVIYAALEKGKSLDAIVGFKIGEGIPITSEVLSEAEEENRQLFDFQINWVPAYFLSKGLGAIWGGCTVVTDTNLALFFIRKDFREKQQWFIYNRRELMAHELCHVARSRLNDPEFEEHFAYMTAGSSLRRFMGNCFRAELDAFIFIVPVFILLAIQLLNAFMGLRIPEYPFWLLALAGPMYLIIRNILTRRTFLRAEENLRQGGISKPRAVLFRCTREEIREIAASNPVEVITYLYKKAETELRFRLICKKYISDMI